MVEDKVYIVGEVKTPGATGLPARPVTPREYVALAGGPEHRAKLTTPIVTFRNGGPTRWPTRRRSRRAPW